MTQETIDHLEALMQRERNYLCSDYMSAESHGPCFVPGATSPLDIVEECAKVVTDLSIVSADHALVSPTAVGITHTGASLKDVASLAAHAPPHAPSAYCHLATWRQQMFEWACTVTDSFGTSREVVAVAFNILDRFLAKECESDVPIIREDYQLFSMTALYMAVKMSESYRKLSIGALIDMSRGFYSEEDIIFTECDILTGIDWRVNPPTSLAFCRLFWKLFPKAGKSFDFKMTCHALTEVAVSDPFFLTSKLSHIGVASILVAAQQHGVPEKLIKEFKRALQDLVDLGDGEFCETLLRLKSRCLR